MIEIEDVAFRKSKTLIIRERSRERLIKEYKAAYKAVYVREPSLAVTEKKAKLFISIDSQPSVSLKRLIELTNQLKFRRGQQ